ncbi:hypothetical protein [Microbispora sp. H10670]|uniref:hypothetical protein n=1 Tax=Microbispora sp. H10670 TaxID=2729108 RepID=UPI001601481C|nr:hypothetical protein [Microbispora sp. H10670]
MTPTNPRRPKEGQSSGPGGPRRRISHPMILATAFVLTATGGVGVAAASAAPVTPPADAPEPVVTTTVTITPTPVDLPAETTTEVPLVGPFLGVLHGQMVVPTKNRCDTVTVFTQTGQAVAVAEGSVTIRSQDGFERSYSVDDSTRVFTGRRGGEIRQDAWVSVVAAEPAPQTPPEATPTPPESTPTPPQETPAPPESTPIPPETTPTPPEATPTPPESTPAPPGETPTPDPQTSTAPAAPAVPGQADTVAPKTEPSPAASQGETAAAAYVFDLSRPSKKLWNLGKSSPYFPHWRSGKPAWRTPQPCPTPTVTPTAPTDTPTDTPTVPTTPSAPAETPADTVSPTPEPTPTDAPAPSGS